DFLFDRRVQGVTDSTRECGARLQTAPHILLTSRRHSDLWNKEFRGLLRQHSLQAIM
ncbi:hypothetical protein K458DRAFT_270263, partial [Lentithecium fluviatile CBS 122367]